MIPPGFISLRKLCAEYVGKNDEIRGRLRYFLVTGGLKGYRFEGGSEYHISADWWKQLTDDLWLNLLNKGAQQEIVFRESDVHALFSRTISTSIIAPQQGREISKSGRPNQFDPDAIWAAIALICLNDGLPPTQEEMIAKVWEQWGNWFGPDEAPSRSTIQPKVNRLFSLDKGATATTVFPRAVKPATSAKSKRNTGSYKKPST